MNFEDHSGATVRSGIDLQWHNSTPLSIQNATPQVQRSGPNLTPLKAAFIGPRRPVGRPRKVVSEADLKSAIGRPSKPVTYGSEDIFERMGKFVSPYILVILKLVTNLYTTGSSGDKQALRIIE